MFEKDKNVDLSFYSARIVFPILNSPQQFISERLHQANEHCQSSRGCYNI